MVSGDDSGTDLMIDNSGSNNTCKKPYDRVVQKAPRLKVVGEAK